MSAFLIEGGRRLFGSAKVHGAKNSVLPILAATIIAEGESVISNCPDLKDVDASIKILRHLGCGVRRENGSVIVDSSTISRFDIPDELMREMRSSVVFLGAIVARMGEAVMSFPGGCELGPRPIDLHLAALRELGCEVVEQRGNIICRAERLEGREITLSIPSVGATENIMLAACACDGVTKITNAAREPEIEDMADFLIHAGAKIRGAGSSTIEIQGKAKLFACEHEIISDRIVCATFLSAAAMAGGECSLERVNSSHVSTVIDILTGMGCDIRSETGRVHIKRSGQLKAVRPIRTMPYPGFPTDAQAPIMAVTTRAEGTTVFVENIFENRFRHVTELARMGADIRVEGRVAVVCGVQKLYGTTVDSTDLRGGAAMVVAALGAEGQTRVTSLRHIDRGYDCLENTLEMLGADIKRVD